MTATPDSSNRRWNGRRATAPWRADIDRAHGAVVLTPSGNITDAVADDLRQCITEALRVGPRLVVDMHAARIIEPAALAALVRGHCDARLRNGTICLAAPSRFVITALHTMRLATVFPMFPNRRTALAWLASPAAATARNATTPTASGA
jgi:anti-sigma B factor antagonist